MMFYLCSTCKMYHRVDFAAERDAAMVWKEEKGIRRLVEPPQFVWQLKSLPEGAQVVESQDNK